MRWVRDSTAFVLNLSNGSRDLWRDLKKKRGRSDLILAEGTGMNEESGKREWLLSSGWGWM